MAPLVRPRARWRFIVVPIVAAAAGLLAVRQDGSRLSDSEVKQIVDDVEHARDRFESQLDSDVKSHTFRTSDNEVSVENYLEDFQTNIDNLKSRFDDHYSASKEAETVLRQGTEINTYMKSQTTSIKGTSEWDSLAMQLNRLAGVYRTSFPLPNGAIVRRINDEEAASTADAFAKSMDDFKKALDDESTLAKPARDTGTTDADAIAKQARTVKSRASDGKPGTAEMRQLRDQVASLNTFVQGQTGLSPKTIAAWNATKPPFDLLAQAYGLKPPTSSTLQPPK